MRKKNNLIIFVFPYQSLSSSLDSDFGNRLVTAATLQRSPFLFSSFLTKSWLMSSSFATGSTDSRKTLGGLSHIKDDKSCGGTGGSSSIFTHSSSASSVVI
ncbi:peptidyl-prolyl isomerase E (cyclophilin E), partial [Trypanosoma cruzi]